METCSENESCLKRTDESIYRCVKPDRPIRPGTSCLRKCHPIMGPLPCDGWDAGHRPHESSDYWQSPDQKKLAELDITLARNSNWRWDYSVSDINRG